MSTLRDDEIQTTTSAADTRNEIADTDQDDADADDADDTDSTDTDTDDTDPS
jgi:hypothetical protein